MNKVTRKEFYEKQANFLHKHECTCEQIGDWNHYIKSWSSEDGASMTEVNRIITEVVEVEIRGIKAKVEIRLMETECYSTEFPSMYIYEQYK